MIRALGTLFFTALVSTHLQADQFPDLIATCQQSGTEHVYLYAGNYFRQGFDLSQVSSRTKVLVPDWLLEQTCFVPVIRMPHCHLEANPYTAVPSSLNPDGSGDIAFLVRHEQVCARVRGYGTRLPPIVHLVVALPQRIVVAYQLGPELLRLIARHDERPSWLRGGAMALAQHGVPMDSASASIRLATSLFDDVRDSHMSWLWHTPNWDTYISPTSMFLGDEAYFVIREWPLP